MSGDDPKTPRVDGDPGKPADGAARTGEGASSALEAMLRKRKQAELPEPPANLPTTPPPA